MSDANGTLELHPVRFRLDGVGEWDQSRFAVFVPRDRIQRITLEHGFQCERPIFAALFGLAVFSVGVVGVAVCLGWFFRGGFFSKYYAALPVALLVGGWMLKTASSRGYFLLIESDSDRRKIAFRPQTSRDQVESFLVEVEQILGYSIQRTGATKLES